METHVDPVVLILDTLPMNPDEMNELYMLNREQLASRIREVIPDDQGDKIARFLKAVSICGWRFADIDEQALQKISEGDAAITEKLLHLQGKTHRFRKLALSRLYPVLAKEGRIRNASSYRRLRPVRDPMGATAPSTTPPPSHSNSSQDHDPPPPDSTSASTPDDGNTAEPKDPAPPQPTSSTQPDPPSNLAPPNPPAASDETPTTSESRANAPGADLNEESSPVGLTRDDSEGRESSEESEQGSPDALLTPLVLVPDLTSDLQAANDDEGSSGVIQGIIIETVKAAPIITEQPFQLRLNVEVPKTPSLLDELSSISPHFSTLPLARAGHPTSASSALTPRSSPTRYLLSPRQDRTLFPASGGLDGHRRCVSASVAPPPSAPSAKPFESSGNGATSGARRQPHESGSTRRSSNPGPQSAKKPAPSAWWPFA